MPKLDVGVGDEFPTEEIHRDENGVVHHHHYYRRRRRPFGFVRFILGLLLIMMVLRLIGFAWNAPMWMLPRDAGMPQARLPALGCCRRRHGGDRAGPVCCVARDWDRPW